MVAVAEHAPAAASRSRPTPYMALAAFAVGIALLAGCSSGSRAATQHANTSLSAAAASISSPAKASTSASRRPAPTVPAVVPAKVSRPGTVGKPSISAAPEPLNHDVTYSDGVAVRIIGITQGVTDGSGPGALPGRPRTQFTVSLRNRSKAAINLDRVVVTVTYGAAHSQALAIYDDGVRDFSGTVAPAGTAQAVYAFSIATDQLTDVVMTVDFDGVHTSATFTGSAKAR
jgi:outer membrane murein-binding lipoprotein Lpp